MKIKQKWIPQHYNGHFITVRCEPTEDESIAVRFSSSDEVLTFLNGIHGPQEPMDYKPVKLRIRYELEKEVEPNE